MKTFLQIFWRIAVLLLIVLACLFLLSTPARSVGSEPVTVNDTIYVYKEEVQVDWSAFVDALIIVESGGNDSAVNYKTKAVGCLQLTPVCVQQVNQILKAEVFDLNDRYDRAKSIAMFDVYQGYYNPYRDIHWALKLWNPRSSIQYHLDVLSKMEKL